MEKLDYWHEKMKFISLKLKVYNLNKKARQNGINQNYSAEFKLKTLKIIEKKSLSLLEAGIRFNIPNIAIISKWKKKFASFGIEGLKSKPRGRPISMSDYKRKKRKTDKPLTREEEL